MNVFVTALIAVICTSLFINSAFAHVCMLIQRGDVDVSGPSQLCYRPDPPCGGETAGPIKQHFEAGKTYRIFFQQNLNHYSIGSPGVFEFSWSQDGDEQNFQVLDTLPDALVHRELRQTNMTYEFTAPNTPTKHAVLRVRYISQKPGEPAAFHQCADVAVTKSQDNHNLASKKSNNVKSGVYALMYDPAESSETSLVRVDISSGNVEQVSSFNMPLRTHRPSESNLKQSDHAIRKHQLNMKFSTYSLLEYVVAHNTNTNELIYLLGYNGDYQKIPDTLMRVDLKKQDGIPEFVQLKEYDPRINRANDLRSPISSIDYIPEKDIYVVMQLVKVDQKTFQLQASKLDIESGYMHVIAKGEPEKYFINFLWSTYNSDSGNIEFLLRNEHDPFNLTQVVTSVNVESGRQTTQQTDESQTFSCYHYTRNGGVYAPSVGAPDIFIPQDSKMTQNKILKFNPQTGKHSSLRLTSIRDLPYQGGCVKHGTTMINNNPSMFHFYKVKHGTQWNFAIHDLSESGKDDIKPYPKYGFLHSFIYVE